MLGVYFRKCKFLIVDDWFCGKIRFLSDSQGKAFFMLDLFVMK